MLSKIIQYKYTIVFVIVIFFSFFIRIHNITTTPPAMFVDELANGYEVYSLIKTGKTMYGESYPIFFNKFNLGLIEPLYLYLSIPLVYIFDLNTFSTRLLSVIAGTLTVLFSYLLIKNLYNKNAALIVSLTLSITPWLIQFSRISFRAILAPLFVVLILYTFYKAKTNYKFYYLFTLISGLSLYTYSTLKVYLPIILLVLLIFNFKFFLNNLIKFNKHFYISLFLFVLIGFYSYYFSFYLGGNSRFDYLSIFVTSNPLQQFITNFKAHFSLNFLFIEGDANVRHSPTGLATFYNYSYLFLPFALYTFVKNKDFKILMFLLLFVLTFIPSSLTNEGIPHVIRSIQGLIFYDIVIGLGIYSFIYLIKNNIYKYLSILLVIIFFIYTLIILNKYYFINYKTYSQTAFTSGVDYALNFTQNNKVLGQKIYVSKSFLEPFIFVTFYLKIDPVNFQLNKNMGDYYECTYQTVTCYDQAESGSLLIIYPYEITGNVVYEKIGYQNLPIVQVIKKP